MSWEKVKLGDVCTITAGQSPESKFYNQTGDGLPFFQGKADFGINTPKIRYYTNHVTKVAKPFDILLSVRAPVGPTNICDVEACIGRGLASIRATEETHYKYVYYFFKSIQRKLSDSGNGSTFSAITTSDVKNIEIPLPPLHIQQHIANVLDKADALRQKDQQLLQKYDELAQSIFYDMFGDPVKNEKGWEVKKLGEVSKQITDGTHFSPPSVDEGIPYITAKHVKNYGVDFYLAPTYVSEEEHKKIYSRCKPELGDILYIKDGATTGIAAINEYDFEFSMLSSLALIKPDYSYLTSFYLRFWLNNPKVKDLYLSEFMSGAAIKRFTLQKIKSFRILVPPIELQNDFAKKLNQISSSIKIVDENLSLSSNLFSSLLAKHFH